MIQVKLEWYEEWAAQAAGTWRQDEAVAAGSKHVLPGGTMGKDPYEVHQRAAGAEMAVAKYLDLYWAPSVNVFKVPDVGNLHVRSTPYANGGLIIRPKDKHGNYVLVTGDFPVFTVVGWIHSMVVVERRDLYRWNPRRQRPAYRVPQGDLHDIASLRQLVCR